LFEADEKERTTLRQRRAVTLSVLGSGWPFHKHQTDNPYATRGVAQLARQRQ